MSTADETTANQTTDLTVARDAGVLVVTIARPAKKNAFTGEMYARFADALDELAGDDSLHCLVVRGEVGVFSAGNDLADFLELDGFADDTPVVRVLRALGAGEKPLLAAVDGPAVGIGTTLLLHCDLVFATPQARFAVPFAPLGLVPEAASSRLLVDLLGYRRAMAMFLLGETMDAQTALDSGLVNRLVDADELDASVMAAAARITALPSAAARATRRLCRAAPASIGDTIEREILVFAERLAEPETRAAIAAVLGGKR